MTPVHAEDTALVPSDPGAHPSFVSPVQLAQPDVPLSFYWAILRRYRSRIALFVLLVTSAATLVALVLPKRYAATGVLRIDPANSRTVGEQDNNANNVSINALGLITTEANEVTSSAVVLQTIGNLHLYQKREFLPHPTDPSGAATTPADMNLVLRNVTRAISVDQPLNSYLMTVSFRSLDPQLSADVANNLLESLIQHDYQTRVEALTGSSQSMRAQLVDLQAKMESSEQALVQYESANDVLNPDSSTNIMQARLSQVNKDLGQAQTQRIMLQADYLIVSGGNLDALIASNRGQYLQPLYQRLQNDQRQLAQMAQMYGPNYPVYRQQQALVQNDEATLNNEKAHITNQIAAEYSAALRQETLLRGELQTQKQNMDSFNLKAIRYYALKAAADAYTKLYYQLQQSIQDATVAASLHSEGLRVVSPARPNSTPVYPRPLLTAALTLLLSSLVGVGAALAVGLLDRTLATPEQVDAAFGLAVLGALPQVSVRNVRDLTPFGYGRKLLGTATAAVSDAPPTDAIAASSPFRESILGLHTALMLMQERDLHVIAVTSSVPAEGKTTVSANLAAAFAGLTGSTVLVDTDMRKPGVHRQFRVGNRRGLSSLLRGQYQLDQVLIDAPGAPNLCLLPGGAMPSSSAQLLHLGLEELLTQLRARFDYVILDCPPVLGFADSMTPANLADGCILVVHADKTDRQLVSGSLRQLQAARAEIVGVVLNGVSQRPGGYYSYYSHYYEYHHKPDSNAADGGAENED